ncbi:uncharacterized protein FOMMEDRAFT_26943 [Fomitiporia mediterranea MF3/22]|uniref:uncharacterized protein n=1 Tax=Fomitiporia mediterranea (strain MF3/22) TaxID=694068 RepID=UPI00044083C3|nr:uncharacterized protein FOMMEDRAFT_26943 [Fomitiporia mediterranea MF3/22]EJD06215.1 hypothetical protein FOMMEDRAFT_26943 [Fomitiporia mediterranea MF3/22]
MSSSSQSSSGLTEKSLSEIAPGMLVFVVNEDFVNISNFLGSKLSKSSRPDKTKQRGHFELVVEVHSDSVETVMMTSFSGAEKLDGTIPRDRWKFCVPIYPAATEDNEQYGPVSFVPGKGTDKHGTGGWLTVQSTSIIRPNSNGKYKVKETDMDRSFLSYLQYLGRSNSGFYTQSIQQGGQRISTSEGQAMLLKRGKKHEGKGKKDRGSSSRNP